MSSHDDHIDFLLSQSVVEITMLLLAYGDNHPLVSSQRGNPVVSDLEDNMKVLARLVDGDETDARTGICREGDLELCRPFCPVELQGLDLENGLCTKVLVRI